MEEVWFESADGTKLHGWYCPSDTPRAVILYAHGNAGNLSYHRPFLERLQAMRLTIFIFDYRGYGRSEGTPTVEGILQDARAARSALAKRAAVDESEIVLIGQSLGGAVAVQLAAEAPPRRLVLECTFSSLKDVAEHHYPYLAWLVPEEKLNSASLISDYDGPLLQFHGDADRTVPYEMGKRLFDAAHEPKTFVTIPGGDHNDARTVAYYETLDRFIEEPSR